MFCKERRGRDLLAERKTKAVAKGSLFFFFAGGFGKRTAISFSNKLDALGERKGVWLDSGETAVLREVGSLFC